MDHYLIWVNLKDTHRDLEFVRAVREYLGRLERDGLLAGWSLTRRKLGFGPPELGEFMLDLRTNDLPQLEAAFARVAAREGDLERAHAAVYSAVKDFRSALYRDFPDPQRPA